MGFQLIIPGVAVCLRCDEDASGRIMASLAMIPVQRMVQLYDTVPGSNNVDVVPQSVAGLLVYN